MKQKRLEANIAMLFFGSIYFFVADQKKIGVHPEPIILKVTYRNNNKSVEKKVVAHLCFH